MNENKKKALDLSHLFVIVVSEVQIIGRVHFILAVVAACRGTQTQDHWKGCYIYVVAA